MSSETEKSEERMFEEELGIEQEPVSSEESVEIEETTETEEATEADLAKKALESSDDQADEAETKEDEETVPLSKYLGEKGKLKENLVAEQIARAKLEGELIGLRKAQGPTASKADEESPVELAMKAEGVTDPDDLEKPFAVMRKQQAWEKKQDAASTASVSQETRSKSVSDAGFKLSQEMTEEKMGEGLDYATIVNEGNKLLSERQGAFIMANKNPDDLVKELYDMSLKVILEKGGLRAEELQGFIDAQKLKSDSKTETTEKAKKEAETKKAAEDKAKGKTKPKVRTNKDEDDVDKLLMESETDEGDAERDTPSSRIMHFMT